MSGLCREPIGQDRGWSGRAIGAFVQRLEAAGQLVRIEAPVSPILEISEILHRVAKRQGPALLFENVEGSSVPLLTNLFGTRERIDLAVGRPLDAELAHTVSRAAAGDFSGSEHLVPGAVAGTGRAWSTAPDLNAFPIMHGWPRDGGRYITFPLVITRNPDTGAVNTGTYRMQVLDGTTTCIHWQSHSDGFHNCARHREHGRDLEVAVVIGCDPVLLLAAAMGVPRGADELALAGVLRGRAVALERCATLDLPVPVSSEIVIEGVVDPGEFHREGPFGDYTGYYSGDDRAAVLHVRTVRVRHDPVYLSTLVGKPSLEFAHMIGYLHALKHATRRSRHADIVDYHAPAEGAFTNFGFIAIRKRHPGHAREVIERLWAEQARPSRVKILVAFDADVNVRDLGEVIWQLGANIDPARDVFFGHGRLDDLNHASPEVGRGSKLGIDATSKCAEEGHPRPWPMKIRMTDDVKARVGRRWREYFPNHDI